MNAIKNDIETVADWIGQSRAITGFPVIARQHQARLAIVNRTATPLDKMADAVIRDDISAVFRDISALLRGTPG